MFISVPETFPNWKKNISIKNLLIFIIIDFIIIDWLVDRLNFELFFFVNTYLNLNFTIPNSFRLIYLFGYKFDKEKWTILVD